MVVDENASALTVVQHERRPLQLIKDRTEFVQNARNLFVNVISAFEPDRLAYVLSMDAKSQDQVAGLILPFAALNVSAREEGKQCVEFIAANFSKSFFTSRKALWLENRYTSADALFGLHPPNWTNNERLAALAAWGAL